MNAGRARLLAVLALAGLARLPFLSAGFGSDFDAWWVALAARASHQGGDYVLSRVPGHPVLDVLNALLVPWGPVGLNGGSAAFGLAACALFHRLATRFGVARPALWTLAFAFLPLVYLQSVQALDYLPALAFLLLAIELACAGRFGFAGVALGFATGCRITSLAMFVPLVALAPFAQRVRAAVRTGAAALATSAALFAPVVLSAGFGVFRFYQTPYPWAGYLLKAVTLDTFGIVGLLGLAFALPRIARLRRPRSPRPTRAGLQLRRFRLCACRTTRRTCCRSCRSSCSRSRRGCTGRRRWSCAPAWSPRRLCSRSGTRGASGARPPPCPGSPCPGVTGSTCRARSSPTMRGGSPNALRSGVAGLGRCRRGLLVGGTGSRVAWSADPRTLHQLTQFPDARRLAAERRGGFRSGPARVGGPSLLGRSALDRAEGPLSCRKIRTHAAGHVCNLNA